MILCQHIKMVYRSYNTGKGVLSTMKEKVEAALNKIRPMLQRDGGGVELVDVEPDGVVKVRLTGACGG